MTDIDLIKQALEYLEDNQHHIADNERHAYVMLYNDCITALKARLAQETALQALHNENKRLGLYKDAYAEPEQEPVAWGVFEGNLHDMFFSQSEAQEMADLKGSHAEVKPLYTTPPQRTEPTCPECKAEVLYECVACSSNNYPPPQRTEQEPTAKYSDIVSDGGLDPRNKFDVPPQRTWVGLTDDELMDMYNEPRSDAEMIAFGREVEAKLKEKNT